MRAVLMIAALAIAVPDREDPTKKDVKPLQEQIQGEWRLVKAVDGGMAENGDKVDGTLLTVKEKAMDFKDATVNHTQKLAFTLDETKKPAAIDLILHQPGRGHIQIPCIIQIEGEMLTLCFHSGGEGGKRPTEFVSPPNTRITILQFTRVQK